MVCNAGGGDHCHQLSCRPDGAHRGSDCKVRTAPAQLSHCLTAQIWTMFGGRHSISCLLGFQAGLGWHLILFAWAQQQSSPPRHSNVIFNAEYWGCGSWATQETETKPPGSRRTSIWTGLSTTRLRMSTRHLTLLPQMVSTFFSMVLEASSPPPSSSTWPCSGGSSWWATSPATTRSRPTSPSPHSTSPSP